MKKIIKSLAIVIAVAAIAGGATYSFFSDTEKSTGNTFTAGNIDLQVDSTSHFNGFVCAMDDDKKYVWQFGGNCTATDGKLVKNGSFETGTDPGSYLGVNTGDNDITDWTIDSGDLDYIGTYWDAENGSRSLDLNGFTKASISQTFNTIPGANYNVTFHMSGNPDSWQSGQPESYKSPNEKVLTVSATGASPSDYAYDTIAKGNTKTDMKWEQRAYIFQATSTSTTLTFASKIDGAFGPALDNIAVPEMICDDAPVMEFANQPCDGTWEAADLVPGVHKLFNFDDIKPGDWGEDTLSLHIKDEDVWGRIRIDVTKDSDGTCVEPELNPVDPDCPDTASAGGAGELRENLKFSVWLDQGKAPGFQGKDDPGEGDNIFNENDTPLISAGEINSTGEEWFIKDAILLAYGENNNTVAPGITADGHMVSGVTYYFGIGWELPSATGNEVQTDVFQSDITFQIEQYSNNPNPFQ